ncbi:unnamed protein product [Sphagnum balticum]
MVTIEVRDIAKLAGYIRIPSMAEGAATTDMIRQSILYSGLPNQCRKCRRFGHQTRTCNITRSKSQARGIQQNSYPNTTHGGQSSTCQASANVSRERMQGPTTTTVPDPQIANRYQGCMEAKIPWKQTLAPPLPTDPIRIHLGSQTSNVSHRSATTGAQVDLSMANPPSSPSRAKGEPRAEAKNPPEEATTPKNKLNFGLHGLNGPQAQKTRANANPFASSDEGSRGGDQSARLHEDTLEGWSFQGRRKHAPKLVPPKPAIQHTLPRTPQQKTTPGGKRVQLHD